MEATETILLSHVDDTGIWLDNISYCPCFDLRDLLTMRTPEKRHACLDILVQVAWLGV